MDPSAETFLLAPSPAPGLPALLLEWQVEEGESVRRGEPIAHILDGSGCSSVLSPCDGRLIEHWVDEGASIGEGQRLARLALTDERPGSDPRPPVGG